MTKKKLNETAAADTLQTKGLPADGGVHDNAADIEASRANADVGPGGAAAGTIIAKGDPKSAARNVIVSEELNAAFEGSGISEEVIEKTKTLFEAAVNARVDAESKALQEEFQAQLDEQVATFKTELTENIDKYLDYIATKWVDDNKVAIVSEIKLDQVLSFQNKLRELMAEHYIEIPEDKLDALGAMTEQAESLKTDLDSQIEENITLKNEINLLKADKIFKEVSEGLAMTDTEKFKVLAGDLLEGTSDEQDLRKKLSVIKESHFKGQTPGKPADKIVMRASGSAVNLNEDAITINTDKDGNQEVKVTKEMASIVAAVNRTTRKY